MQAQKLHTVHPDGHLDPRAAIYDQPLMPHGGGSGPYLLIDAGKGMCTAFTNLTSEWLYLTTLLVIHLCSTDVSG